MKNIMDTLIKQMNRMPKDKLIAGIQLFIITAAGLIQINRKWPKGQRVSAIREIGKVQKRVKKIKT